MKTGAPLNTSPNLFWTLSRMSNRRPTGTTTVTLLTFPASTSCLRMSACSNQKLKTLSSKGYLEAVKILHSIHIVQCDLAARGERVHKEQKPPAWEDCRRKPCKEILFFRVDVNAIHLGMGGLGDGLFQGSSSFPSLTLFRASKEPPSATGSLSLAA